MEAYINITNSSNITINNYNHIPTKMCKKCFQIKELKEFNSNNRTRDGYYSCCRNCYNFDQRQRQTTPQFKEYRNQFMKEKREENESFRISCNLRSRLYSSLKGNPKAGTTKELTGLPNDKLLKWLEFNKSSDVTDKKPHIDHLLPCKSFDLSNPEEQKICFHWRNLRYMNAKENISKSAKLPSIEEIILQQVMANFFEEVYLSPNK
jgi:hypothetical protein